MLKRECVNLAVLHKNTEYIPYNIELTRDVEEHLEQMFPLSKGDFSAWAGNHIDKCGLDFGKTIRPGFYEDEFGVVWDRSGQDKDIGNISEFILKEPSMDGYALPMVDPALINAKCEAFFKTQRDTFRFAKIGMTLFERAWSLRGFENFLMDLMIEDEFALSLLEAVAERNMKILECALAYDFDGFYFGDDYGQQTGTLMSPDTWRKFIKPQLKRMFERIKLSGKFICLHSCGKIDTLLGDLIDIGLDIYQTVQPEVYDLQVLKNEYGRDLTFYGAISTQRDLPFRKPAEIKAIVHETMAVLGKGGGYIAAPTHRITADVPLENLIALTEAFREQRGA